MKRKLIKQGHNTLTLSLPKKWCKRNKLEEGQELDILERGENLILSREISKGIGKVNVDITGLDRSTIIMLITSLYTYGYDLIIINTKDKKAKYYLPDKELTTQSIINYSVNRLIGAEIISSSNESYKIEIITEESREKFDTILRRIFLILMEMFDTFIQASKTKDKSLMQSVEFQHLNTRKFINYALRLLNKFGYKDAEKTTFYFSIIILLGKINEIIKNFAGYTTVEGTLNQSKNFCNLTGEISKSLKLYYQSFYKYNVKQISQIHKNRDLFKRNLYKNYKKLSKDDLFILGNIMQIFSILLDLSELRIAIGYS